MVQHKAILLMGPTASGKTDLALMLATKYPIEIISVDSALVYQDMDIGTAKPSVEQLNSVPHHLINIISPLETYSLAEFIKDSTNLIYQITKRGKLPLLVGGTMMYYNGLINGISALPVANQCVRAELEEQILLLGLNSLHTKLLEVDPVASAKIMPTDKQRIIRALEVFYLTGKPISQLQQENKIKHDIPIDFLPLTIIPSNREMLHQRINQRFQKMLEYGFIEEVKQLQAKYPALTSEHTAMRSVGYYQVWQYLANKINYAELTDQGMAATRQLAKRQITWLRSFVAINLYKSDLEITELFKQLVTQLEVWLN